VEHRTHSPGTAEHLLQLFDSDGSRAESVAAYVRAGLAGGDAVLLVLTGEHWSAVRTALGGRAADPAIHEGRLVVKDAQAALRAFMHRGVPDASRFDASIGTLVRQLTATGARLRVYGEMVDLLAIAGEFEAARELETLWNQLVTIHPFTLFCGYSAVSFGDPRSAHALRALCAAHSRVVATSHDVLGTFLLGAYR